MGSFLGVIFAEGTILPFLSLYVYTNADKKTTLGNVRVHTAFIIPRMRLGTSPTIHGTHV